MKKERNKKLQKLWVLYGAFFCIMMVLVGLFVSDAFNTSDYEEFVQFKEKQESLNLATAKSTDLRNGSSDYDFTIPIINPNQRIRHNYCYRRPRQIVVAIGIRYCNTTIFVLHLFGSYFYIRFHHIVFAIQVNKEWQSISKKEHTLASDSRVATNRYDFVRGLCTLFRIPICTAIFGKYQRSYRR